jgi:hypothetical protein
MCNRWPNIFRETFMLRQEVSGPGGGMVPVQMNPFVVEVLIQGELPQHPQEPKQALAVEIPILGNGNGNGNGQTNGAGH